MSKIAKAQMNIFDLEFLPGQEIHQQHHFQDTLRLVEWFGGIGAFSAACRYLKINHQVVDYIDNDKYATQSFNAMNNTTFMPTDINNVDVKPYGQIDLLVMGFPCQDFSLAGKRQGLNGPKSSLIAVAIAKIKQMQSKPHCIVLENVVGLLNKNFSKQYDMIKSSFINMGYHWDQAVLNAKYFGVPQDRKRVFILLTYHHFPAKSLAPLTTKHNYISESIVGILDFEVPFYKLNAPSKKIFNEDFPKKQKFYFQNEMSTYFFKIIEVDCAKLQNQKWGIVNQVATLGTLTHSKKFTPIAYKASSRGMGGYGIYPTLAARRSSDTGFVVVWMSRTQEFTYRALTEKECWRMMGFQDHDFHQAARQTSPNQLYRQAGNSLVVPIAQEIIQLITFKESNND